MITTLGFQIFEATNAKSPNTKPDIIPITGPVNNIIILGCLGIGIVESISI
jgi:hypothetical protein